MSDSRHWNHAPRWLSMLATLGHATFDFSN